MEFEPSFILAVLPELIYADDDKKLLVEKPDRR